MVVPVLELQMLVKAQSFLKSVAIQVQVLLISILPRFTDCLVFRIDLATQICYNVFALSFVPQRALPLTARQYGEVVLPDASTGQNPGTLARKLSRCKEGMARVFAVMVQILLRSGAIAVQIRSEPQICPRLQIWWRTLAQCRGTTYLEARNLSRCKILIACRCACPGVITITKLS